MGLSDWRQRAHAFLIRVHTCNPEQFIRKAAYSIQGADITYFVCIPVRTALCYGCKKGVAVEDVLDYTHAQGSKLT